MQFSPTSEHAAVRRPTNLRPVWVRMRACPEAGLPRATARSRCTLILHPHHRGAAALKADVPDLPAGDNEGETPHGVSTLCFDQVKHPGVFNARVLFLGNHVVLKCLHPVPWLSLDPSRDRGLVGC